MVVGGSFKDPIGNVVKFADHIERTCAPKFIPQIKSFLSSAIFRDLVKQQKLLPAHWDENTSRIHQPLISYWTYPFEWSFSMLKDAALLTLALQRSLLDHGYVLKDSSAYNVAFVNGKAIFADLYSVEPFQPRIAWSGYDQFCREFLNPLLLQRTRKIPFQPYFRGSLNGIPSSHAAKLLPFWRVFLLGCVNHVFLKSWLEAKPTPRSNDVNARQGDRVTEIDEQLARELQTKVASSLHTKISGITLPTQHSHWLAYRASRTYQENEIARKREIVTQFCSKDHNRTIIDYGCNDGEFSELISHHYDTVIATDIDEACIDAIYNRQCTGAFPSHVVLAVQDLANPSVRLGWNGEERLSFPERLVANSFLALALVHHLRISHNIPTEQFLRYWKAHHQAGIIEYVGLADPMVTHLLRNRPGFDHSDYERDTFINTVQNIFRIEQIHTVSSSRELIIVTQ